ncbi:hypothetical protein B9T38_14095 [Acinetobacter sp. ANC 4218]|nr:hypothetical protein B9T38_14095 [Acinetobacter sp. ANC 4218]
MVMKQTQTKLFDFSDAGLDFCAGSKALFPDRFKKMLALGYNVQTVTGVTIVGDQVTLTYGGAHGYVADRVLKVDSGDLSLINNGEFWIDSVTINTVTFTLDNIPSSIANGFSTRIASLGWALEYESGQVQLYKMKYLDERNLYVRLVFPSIGATRGSINVCVGKTANVTTGVITDVNSLPQFRDNLNVLAGFEWQLCYLASATYDNYNYSQGLSIFGRACVVGSQYHIALMINNGHTGGYAGCTYGILPTVLQKYEVLDYPVVIGIYNANALTSSGSVYQFNFVVDNSFIYVGSIHAAIDPANNTNLIAEQSAAKVVSSFVSTNIDSFNTSLAYPVSIFDKPSKQHLGFIAAGLYRFEARYGTSPPSSRLESPSTSMDIDLAHLLKIHASNTAASASSVLWFCAPVEEVKIAS